MLSQTGKQRRPQAANDPKKLNKLLNMLPPEIKGMSPDGECLPITRWVHAGWWERLEAPFGVRDFASTSSERASPTGDPPVGPCTFTDCPLNRSMT